jgi:hypothetical protein
MTTEERKENQENAGEVCTTEKDSCFGKEDEITLPVWN